jgi:hypothetical protein
MLYKVQWRGGLEHPYLVAKTNEMGQKVICTWTRYIDFATLFTIKEIREMYPVGFDNLKLIPFIEPGEIECNTTKRCIDTTQIEERDAKV